MTCILGIDPGLQHTGWGIIRSHSNQLEYIACGVIHTNNKLSMPERLKQLHTGLEEIIRLYKPNEAAVEETFINKNATSSLKLGQARGAIILSLSLGGLSVAEYSANLIKKSVVGSGHADKNQVGMMIKTLLPKSDAKASDSADALAVAICHAHHRK